MSGSVDLGLKAIAFVDALGAVDTSAQLVATLRETVEALGITATSAAVVSGSGTAPSRQFFFLDWPQDWLGLYQEENFFKIDPIPRWAIRNGRAASFTEVAGRLPTRDPGLRVVEAARTNHFGEGLLVPIRSPGGATGIVSLGGDRDALNESERAFLEIVSTNAFHRAAALQTDKHAPFNAALTRRELDCLDLLVRGLGDREMAARLGISEPAVRLRLNTARRKTGAVSRTHLAALAIWLGLSRL